MKANIAALLTIVTFSITVFAADKNETSAQKNSDALPIPSYCGSVSGLRMRDKPDLNAGKIAVIPYGEKIDLLEIQDDTAEIDSIRDYWCRVRYDGKIGWVFGGYLFRNDPKTTKNKPASQALINTWIPCVMIGAWYTFNSDGTYSVYLDGTDAPGWKGDYVFSSADKTLTVRNNSKEDTLYKIKFINTEVLFLENGMYGTTEKFVAQTTPLHTAVIKGNVAAVKKILTGKEDVHQYAYGYLGNGPALLYACEGVTKKMNSEIISMLLEKGADPNLVYYPDLKTSLHEALGKSDDENTDIVDLLIKHKVNVNAKNRNGDTPLHFCVYGAGIKNNLKVIQKLLDSGADLRIKNKKGKTPGDLALELLKSEGKRKDYAERMEKVIQLLGK